MSEPAARRGRATLTVEVMIQSPLWNAEPMARDLINRAVAQAATLVPAEGEVSVQLVSDDAMRALNRDWRGSDKPTNVLSFPSALAATQAPGRILGDIVIAYETVAQEARAGGLPFGHHLAHLAIHGFLHLLGYDHESEPEADAMERLEVAILSQLDIPDPYNRGRS